MVLSPEGDVAPFLRLAVSLLVADYQAGNLRAQSNAVNLPGLTGKSERVVLNLPAGGSWRIRVRNTFGILGTSQPFSGVLQIGRARYARISDADYLNPDLRSDVYQDIRSLALWPIGSKFRPDYPVSRSDLATALVLGARVPQYLPGIPSYQDARDNPTMSFVESAQASPTGSLFVDVTPGGRFRPNDTASRLTAAVALVRAGGLRSEAEARSNMPLAFLDAASIPAEFRGYVSVAVSRGLIQGDTLFRPQNAFTRADLAHAIAVLENQSIQ